MLQEKKVVNQFEVSAHFGMQLFVQVFGEFSVAMFECGIKTVEGIYECFWVMIEQVVE